MDNDNEYEKYLNPKTTKRKTTTNDLHDDLVRYLNERLVEIPTEKDKQIIMRNIGIYYKSLDTLLVKFNTKHPQMSKS